MSEDPANETHPLNIMNADVEKNTQHHTVIVTSLDDRKREDVENSIGASTVSLFEDNTNESKAQNTPKETHPFNVVNIMNPIQNGLHSIVVIEDTSDCINTDLDRKQEDETYPNGITLFVDETELELEIDRLFVEHYSNVNVNECEPPKDNDQKQSQ
eukprot:261729_1